MTFEEFYEKWGINEDWVQLSYGELEDMQDDLWSVDDDKKAIESVDCEIEEIKSEISSMYKKVPTWVLGKYEKRM